MYELQDPRSGLANGLCSPSWNEEVGSGQEGVAFLLQLHSHLRAPSPSLLLFLKTCCAYR